MVEPNLLDLLKQLQEIVGKISQFSLITRIDCAALRNFLIWIT